MQVMINGFGRIGRTVLRAWLQGHWPDVQIVAINDIAPAETCAYLLEFDSTYGPLPGVRLLPGVLMVGDHRLALTHQADLSRLNLSDIDLVLECTGKADTPAIARAGLQARARRVLVSGPSKAVDATVVLGANDDALNPGLRVISNASCTTNALAPVVRLLDRNLGITAGWMTTII